MHDYWSKLHDLSLWIRCSSFRYFICSGFLDLTAHSNQECTYLDDRLGDGVLELLSYIQDDRRISWLGAGLHEPAVAFDTKADEYCVRALRQFSGPIKVHRRTEQEEAFEATHLFGVFWVHICLAYPPWRPSDRLQRLYNLDRRLEFEG